MYEGKLPPKPFEPKRRALLYLVSLPADILWGWPIILLIRLLWGKNFEWESEALVCDLRPESWPARTWYTRWGGTTLSPHAIFYKDGLRNSPGKPWAGIQVHEHVHVEQGEASCLRSFLVALGTSVLLLTLGHSWPALWAGLILWILGYPLMGIANWGTAWLRGEEPYEGSNHEESAYAQGEIFERDRNAELRRAARAKMGQPSMPPPTPPPAKKI